jgi:branched-subunit amino acid ABC-type transport system permease component
LRTENSLVDTLIIGGISLAFTQRVLPVVLVRNFGTWIAGYQALVPMIVIFVVLIVEPRGVMWMFSRVSRWIKNKRGDPGQNP